MMRSVLIAAAVVAVCGGTANADVIFGTAPANPPFVASSNPADQGVIGAQSEDFGPVITMSNVGTLTDKNTDDQGLGVTVSGSQCSDTLCEAQPGQSITATASSNAIRINDAEIGSIEPGESFDFFVDGVKVASGVTNACDAPGFSPGGGGLSCVWNDPNPAGAGSIAVTDVSGSILLTSVSFPTGGGPSSVPEPHMLGLLGGALLFTGYLWRRRGQVD